MLGEPPRVRRQPSRVDDDVIVGEHDELAQGVAQPAVAARREAGAALGEQADARVLGKPVGDRLVLAPPVVDEQHLE